MKLFTRDYFFLTKEQNTLSPNYLTTLRELGATTQQIALNSFYVQINIGLLIVQIEIILLLNICVAALIVQLTI